MTLWARIQFSPHFSLVLPTFFALNPLVWKKYLRHGNTKPHPNSKSCLLWRVPHAFLLSISIRIKWNSLQNLAVLKSLSLAYKGFGTTRLSECKRGCSLRMAYRIFDPERKVCGEETSIIRSHVLVSKLIFFCESIYTQFGFKPMFLCLQH